MRKALVFVSAFALVLVAGAAFALMGTPGGDDVAVEGQADIEKPTTTEAEEPAKPTGDPSPQEADKAEERVENQVKDEPAVHQEQKSQPEEEEAAKSEEVDDTIPPEIVIVHPENGQHFEEKRIAFEGTTEPGARVFAGKYEADVDEEGNFRIVLILQSGGNLATLKAVDLTGNESTAQVKAYYDPPKDEKPADEEGKKKDDPKEHGFTASQKYGSCGEDIPYDKWYGTGEPGTKIWIVSDFGEGFTTVGESGEWHLRVEFPESPCNDTFSVVLETDQGHRNVFEFTRLCDAGGHEEEK